jgi:protocatechuate 3,4-dioxygenase, alpha subunit
MADATPSQTVGPYLEIVMPWADGPVADPDGVRVHGYVLDGAGARVPDALVETWQSSPGAYARCPTDDEGHWEVIVPPAAFVSLHVFARGLLRHLTTRAYLGALTPGDPALAAVPEDRRATLLAEDEGDGYRFDIRLQGEEETVFFDV